MSGTDLGENHIASKMYFHSKKKCMGAWAHNHDLNSSCNHMARIGDKKGLLERQPTFFNHIHIFFGMNALWLQMVNTYRCQKATSGTGKPNPRRPLVAPGTSGAQAAHQKSGEVTTQNRELGLILETTFATPSNTLGIVSKLNGVTPRNSNNCFPENITQKNIFVC